MDFIITVCDSAASETCPIWPGHPATVHWGLSDPAAVVGDDNDIMEAFRETFEKIERKVHAFLALPLDRVGDMELVTKIREIGELE